MKGSEEYPSNSLASWSDKVGNHWDALMSQQTGGNLFAISLLLN